MPPYKPWDLEESRRNIQAPTANATASGFWLRVADAGLTFLCWHGWTLIWVSIVFTLACALAKAV